MIMATVAASEVPFRLAPSHFYTRRLSIDSIALNSGRPKSVLYEHADTESKTNDIGQGVWAWCSTREKHNFSVG
jgi:hypothetical protein